MTSKILVIDVETSPNLVYSWGLYKQNISLPQIVKPSQIICFAAKYVGEKEIFFYSEWEHGRKAMLEAAHSLLMEADAVVGYNQAAFDLPKFTGEFLLAGMQPPPPPTNIDLLKAVKKFGFLSNKLAFVGPLLSIGSKTKHAGFELWAKVMDGDDASRKKMKAYNIQDVKLTEQLYKRILPYIPTHPTLGDTKKGTCPACGSNKIQSRGYRRTKSFKTQRLHCQSCGSWHNGVRSKV